jgi:hypothetical protein
MPWTLDLPRAHAPDPTVRSGSLSDPDLAIEVVELPDEAPVSGGLLQVYENRGFERGRRRGFREAQALVSLAVEELIADAGLGEIPPSLLRTVAAALTSRLDRYTPHEAYVEGGLGI